MKNKAFATKISMELTKALDDVCQRFGYKKSALVEIALREKIEDILDANDLAEAIQEETVFHDWESAKKRLKRAGK